MHRRIRRRRSFAALAIGLGLFTAGCGPLSGADKGALKTTTTPSASPSPSPSPDRKPLDAAALLDTAVPAEAYQVEPAPAEVRQPASVKPLSNPVCGQFLGLKDGLSATVVVTQGLTFKADAARGGMTTAAYKNVADARDAFAQLRTTRAACPSFSAAGTPNAPVVSVVDRTAPPEGDEALAFALTADLSERQDTLMEEHVVVRVGAAIIDFRKMSFGGDGPRGVPTFLMSGQVTRLVQAQL
ncbi:hypothetical protein ACWGDE_34880 [Streptomyces sp. NPDC054956]